MKYYVLHFAVFELNNKYSFQQDRPYCNKIVPQTTQEHLSLFSLVFSATNLYVNTFKILLKVFLIL